MNYWRRPKFWLLLALNELAAFILAALLSIGAAALVASLMIPTRVGIWIDLGLWALSTFFFSYSAFCDVRNQALLWPSPSPRGFPVILPDHDQAE